MSADWSKLITILCLCCTALTGQESGGVVWRDIGEAIIIQCRPPESDQDTLTLKQSFVDDPVLVKESYSDKATIGKEFTGRLQTNGSFTSMDILIQNLTSADTGLYWCYYSKFDPQESKTIHKRGNGSLLLVVTDTSMKCDPEIKDPVLLSVVISAAVLVGIIGVLIWVIRKTKTAHIAVKPQRITTNDVYEDMRGTLRR